MKSTVLTLILSFLFQFSFSQASTDSIRHLTFKGVPIDGKLSAFTTSMEKAGFTHVITEDGVAMFEGDFAGYKKCRLGAVTFDQKDLVSKIVILFPESDTWELLSTNYFNLKQLLTEKYGQPSVVVEKFIGAGEPKDDSSKLFAVYLNNCKYHSTYELTNGTIKLSIENGDYNGKFVKLSYVDKINGELIRQKALDDL